MAWDEADPDLFLDLLGVFWCCCFSIMMDSPAMGEAIVVVPLAKVVVVIGDTTMLLFCCCRCCSLCLLLEGELIQLDIPEGIPRAVRERDTQATTRKLAGRGNNKVG